MAQRRESLLDRLLVRGVALFVAIAHVDFRTGEVKDGKAHASPMLASVAREVGFLPRARLFIASSGVWVISTGTPPWPLRRRVSDATRRVKAHQAMLVAP